MNGNHIPKIGATWLKVTERRQELKLISEPTPWVSHWDVSEGKSRQCGGPDCYLCALGVPKQLRVVVLGLDSRSNEKLVELRERHRWMFDQYPSLVGLVIGIRKAGAARNSPVEVDCRDFEAANARDISRLVQSFGLPAIRIGKEAEVQQPEDCNVADD